MDKDHELTDKVDALLSKHGFGHTPSNGLGNTPSSRDTALDDRNIPVLTEVIDAPAWNAEAAARPSNAIKQLNDDEIDGLSHEIFTRVFDRIDAELATKLEARLAAQLTTHINSAVTHVLGDLRQDIANEIGDAVNAALADHLRKK